MAVGHRSPPALRRVCRRLVDANCDGAVDEQDPPNVVFVSGRTSGNCCGCNDPDSCATGVLRVLDGSTGAEIWSLDQGSPGDLGFAGTSVALGDVDADGFVDIVALTGDGYPIWIDRNGQVRAIADEPVPINPNVGPAFGWGGALSLGDLGGDGTVEVSYGRDVYTISNLGIFKLWQGAGGLGGGYSRMISYMVDLDGNGTLELLAGNTAYLENGQPMWTADEGVPDGFTAVGDLDVDG